MLAWESAYKIGEEEMDSEHLILFSILNQLDINIDNDMAGDCLVDVLGALSSYILYHFAHEEALMASHRFPGIEAHKARHSAFVAEVARQRDAARDGGDVVRTALKVRSFVLDWLLNHILSEDAAYARFIAAA